MRNRKYLNYIIILSVASVISLSGACDHAGHSHGDEHNHHDHTADHSTSGELDQSQRWPLDASTRHAFTKIESTIQHADRSDLTKLQDTGRKLEEQKNNLIQGCSMTGEPHNQLHIFLSNFNKAIEQLTKAQELAEAQNAIASLDEQVAIFRRTFE